MSYLVRSTHPEGWLIATAACPTTASALAKAEAELADGFTVTIQHGGAVRDASDDKPRVCSLCEQPIEPKASDIGMVHGSWRAQHEACRRAALLEAQVIRSGRGG